MQPNNKIIIRIMSENLKNGTSLGGGELTAALKELLHQYEDLCVEMEKLAADEKIADHSAFIFRKLVVDGKIVGAIGVIGPSRMDYSKVVSTVEYLSEQITKTFGNALPEKKQDDDPGGGS